MLRGYDPVREESHWRMICYGVTLGLLTVLVWYNTILEPSFLESIDQDLSKVAQGLLWLFLMPACLIIGEVIMFLYAWKTRVRRLHLRMMALEGTAPVCSPPSLAALPIMLPYTLRIRMHIVRGLLKSYAGSGFFYILVVSGLVLSMMSNNFPSQRVPLLVPTLFPLVWFIWTLVQVGWGAPTLTLDDESITAHYWRDCVKMRWEDMRFFAITGESEQSRKVAFELSDGKHIIRWFDVTTTIGADTYVPEMEAAQYKALMQTLPHWICTRTGLPLYDLRASSTSGVKEK